MIGLHFRTAPWPHSVDFHVVTGQQSLPHVLCTCIPGASQEDGRLLADVHNFLERFESFPASMDVFLLIGVALHYGS